MGQYFSRKNIKYVHIVLLKKTKLHFDLDHFFIYNLTSHVEHYKNCCNILDFRVQNLQVH